MAAGQTSLIWTRSSRANDREHEHELPIGRASKCNYCRARICCWRWFAAIRLDSIVLCVSACNQNGKRVRFGAASRTLANRADHNSIGPKDAQSRARTSLLESADRSAKTSLVLRRHSFGPSFKSNGRSLHLAARVCHWQIKDQSANQRKKGGTQTRFKYSEPLHGLNRAGPGGQTASRKCEWECVLPVDSFSF